MKKKSDWVWVKVTMKNGWCSGWQKVRRGSLPSVIELWELRKLDIEKILVKNWK